jgi:DNA-directed RNA polymerase subunit H (RpoH/RPB5)
MASPSTALTAPAQQELRFLAADQMNQNPAMVVIDTLHNYFLPYRNMRYVGLEGATAPSNDAVLPTLKAPDRKEAIKQLEDFGYYRINARRNKPRGNKNAAVASRDAVATSRDAVATSRDAVVILVLSTQGKYFSHGPDLRALLETITKYEKPATLSKIDEVMIVAEADFFSKKNMTNVLAEFATRVAPEHALDADADGVSHFVTARPYTAFYTCIPECDAVSRYRLLSPAEVGKILEWHRIKMTSLKVLYDNDPALIWLGARPGQVVQEERDSETAQVAVDIFRVIAHPTK